MADMDRVDRVLATGAETQAVAGVVAMAATRDDVVYQGAYGKRELGKPAPMTLDTVGWIASMTKAVTGAAAMQLVEQGRLALDEPISTVLPQLADPQVLLGFQPDGTPRTRPAQRPITLRHLLTHTSGHTYDIWNTEMGRWQAHAGVPGITGCQKAALTTPLIADPGDRWEYGIGIDWAGQAVEAVAGTDLETYLRANLFEPLGMRDTAFRITPSMRERLASIHARAEDGSLAPFPFELAQAPEFQMGGGGLYSTAGDYLRFARTILRGGELDGARVLRAETVDTMAANAIGEVDVAMPMRTAMPPFSVDVDVFPGMRKKWGLSFMINTEQAPTGRSAGSLAWAGLANSYYWIDRSRGVCGVFVSQTLPFADPRAIGLFGDFESAVYQAI